MEEDRKKRGGAIAIPLIGAILVLLTILYVLSIGPWFWLTNHGYFPGNIPLYAPLQWVRDCFEPFDKALGWYLRFFI